MTENEALNYLRQIDPKHIECVELIDMGGEVWDNIPQAVSVAEKALKEIQQYRAIGTVEECREEREVKQKITEIVNQQLIAGKNNYKEVYDCFYKIVKVIQEYY